MRLRNLCLLAFLALSSLAAQATSLGRVEQVQGPAWLLREGRHQPLVPGTQLRDHDRIETGADARVYLMLGDGGRIKLGAGARFAIAQGADKGDRIYRALLDVATGAFRYTTGLLKKLQPRDIAIRVGTSTIGIRGTDVWGRASADEDMAVLIEGHVQVRRGTDAVDMQQPLTQYRASKDGAIQPLASIDMATLASLARETEIDAATGARSARGRWALAVGTVDNQDGALALYDTARAAGFAARIRPITRAGQTSYTVLIPGYASRREASAAALRVEATTGLPARATR